MHDTRIALVKKALSKIKAANAALGTTHLGNSLVIWNSYVTFAVDVNDIELTDLFVDAKELKKAFDAKLSFRDAIDASATPFTDETPMSDEAIEQLSGGEQSIVDPWTEELGAMCVIFNAYKIVSLHQTRPNLAAIARVDSGHLCVTNGYVMFEAETDLPQGFRLPGRLADIVGSMCAGKKPLITPLLLHTGRYDGADSVRVDATTPSGHMVSAFTLAETQKFPPTSQLQEHYLIDGKRVNTYVDLSANAASIPTKIPDHQKVVFTHETDDVVAGAYLDYKIGGKDVWECDATSAIEPEGDDARKRATERVVFQYEVLRPALTTVEDMLLNVVFVASAPCPLMGRISGVNVRGLVVPLRD